MKSPCNGCDRRHYGCHGNWEEYAAFVADMRARLDYVRRTPADYFTVEEAAKNKRRNAR